MGMSLLLRRIHLYLALFLAPWVLMYTASTFAMNHREEGGTPPKFVLERELPYSGDMPEGATPRQIALQVLGALEMDGAHTVVRGSTAEKVIIQRQLPVNPRRITYTAADKRITVERMEFRTGAFLERMHRRGGISRTTGWKTCGRGRWTSRLRRWWRWRFPACGCGGR